MASDTEAAIAATSSTATTNTTTTTTAAAAAAATPGGPQACQAAYLRLVLLVPGGQAVEQAERELRVAVVGHLVLVFAPLLREGAHALVHPLVAKDLDFLGCRGRSRRLGRCVVDDVVDDALFFWVGLLVSRVSQSRGPPSFRFALSQVWRYVE